MRRLIVALVCSVLATFSVAGTVQSTFVPVNAATFKLTRPDGAVMYFYRTADDPDCLLGDDPWVGEIAGPVATVMTRPDLPKPSGFRFKDGKLRAMLVDGVEHKPPRDAQPKFTDIKDFWTVEAEANWSEDALDIWKKSDRLKLWYRNPNKAAAFLGELAFLLLGLVLLRFRFAKVGGVAAFLVLFGLLVLTQSRGAFLGCLFSLAALTLPQARRLGRKKGLWCGVALVVFLVALWFVLPERFTTGLFTQSYAEKSRIPIWSQVPSMMCTAPWGWGLGTGGNVYCNWFQPLERTHFVRTLVSSHLTWMVELGFLRSFLYLTAWFTVLFATYRSFWRGRSFVPFAVLLTFCVAAFFNPIADDWTLWLIPVVVLGHHIWRNRYDWRLIPVTAAGGGLAGVLLVLVACWGGRGHPLVRCQSGCLYLGDGEAQTVLVDDNLTLHGGNWVAAGKELRTYYRDFPETAPLVYTTQLADMPRGLPNLVLVGSRCGEFLFAFAADPQRFASVRTIRMISPDFDPKDIPQAIRARNLKVTQGEFVAQLCAAPRPDYVRVVKGAAIYIPDWIEWSTSF